MEKEKWEQEYDNEFGSSFFMHSNCECMGCDAEKDNQEIKAFIQLQLDNQKQSLLAEIEETILSELRKAPIEVQMTKGAIFADIIKLIKEK